MHGIQVVGKQTLKLECRVILRKGQFKAQCLTWDKVPKRQILISSKSSYIKY